MAKFKHGFSLAEVLIALGIVSVIATMGFTIAKKSIDRAYDMYVYTGYKGITDAIADANASGYNIEYNNVGSCQFSNHVYDVLNSKEVDGTSGKSANSRQIRVNAPNGISYEIKYAGDGNNAITSGVYPHYYFIKMTIPARKKTSSNKDTVCLCYMPDDDYGVLIPFNSYATECTSTITNLVDRKDLLPFYIDNGIAGKAIPSDSGSNVTVAYHRIAYKSLREAICSMYSKSITAMDTLTLLDCSGSTVSNFGVLRLANPRKL